ncbi:MAG: hypothetical protein EPO08_06860 [Rhodospirillaceae bacterium]|nr:MAG: hypothetical protein EPO08_06860 [Rhodospirillaceae bacterium]
MDKLVVGIAVIAALASGTYAYMMRGELDREKAMVTTAEQSVSMLKRGADDAAKKAAAANASLDTCTTQLSDVQAKLEAITSKKPGRQH